MLALFKGEIGYNELIHQIPKKRLMILIDARTKRIVDESNALSKNEEDMRRRATREEILKK